MSLHKESQRNKSSGDSSPSLQGVPRADLKPTLKSTVRKYRSGVSKSVFAFVLVAMTFLSTYVVLSYSHDSKMRRAQHEFSMDTREQSFAVKALEREVRKSQSVIADLSKKSKRRSLGIFTVTAYDPIESCKPFDDGITSVGLPVGMGIAAVDPRVIPYGSVLYLPELGRYFFASDTGSAMKRGKGRNIDILMPTVREALRFGKKHLRVELINLR